MSGTVLDPFLIVVNKYNTIGNLKEERFAQVSFEREEVSVTGRYSGLMVSGTCNRDCSQSWQTRKQRKQNTGHLFFCCILFSSGPQHITSLVSFMFEAGPPLSVKLLWKPL